jgi:hypothetical protein
MTFCVSRRESGVDQPLTREFPQKIPVGAVRRARATKAGPSSLATVARRRALRRTLDRVALWEHGGPAWN